MREGDRIETKKIQKALIKKAFGYDSTEIIEEYVSGEEGDIKLSKKKVTKKEVPPDIQALKMLLDSSEQTFSSLTNEELEREKTRLLKLLEKENRKKKGEKSARKN